MSGPRHERLDVLSDLFDCLADGDLDRDEFVALISALGDALVPTGPLDPFDSSLWEAAVSAVFLALERRTPDELLAAERAARWEGRLDRAERLARRRTRMEERRARRDGSLSPVPDPVPVHVPSSSLPPASPGPGLFSSGQD